MGNLLWNHKKCKGCNENLIDCVIRCKDINNFYFLGITRCFNTFSKIKYLLWKEYNRYIELEEREKSRDSVFRDRTGSQRHQRNQSYASRSRSVKNNLRMLIIVIKIL